MKNQTAVQQLIDEIVEHLTYDDDLSEDSRITLETIRLRLLSWYARLLKVTLTLQWVGLHV